VSAFIYLALLAAIIAFGPPLVVRIIAEPKPTEAQRQETAEHLAEIADLKLRMDIEEAWETVPRDPLATVHHLPLPLRSVPVQREPGVNS
jgi:hypothetical protein